MRPPLLFYCQHSVGLGHLIRSHALCAALAERFRVVLVCGGALPRGIEPPRGVEVVALPPLGVDGNGGFVSHDPRYTLERAWEARAELLQRTLQAVRPRVVLVELFPFGRAKFARELVPLLEAARRAGALTACSMRDILVTGRPNQRAHDDRACASANAHLDAGLVHSETRGPCRSATRASSSRAWRSSPTVTGAPPADRLWRRSPTDPSWSRQAAGSSASRCCARRSRRSGSAGSR